MKKQNRREFIKASAIGTSILLAGGCTESLKVRSAKRPNIIYIYTDQQSAAMMSCAGNKWLKTPAMDYIAENGIRFTRAYTTNPVCSPARVSLMTGRFPGAFNDKKGKPARENSGACNLQPLSEEVKNTTLGAFMQKSGYAVSRQKLLCLDAGHFHPTEMISDKISSVMMFCPELLLHVSRPVRWDSDHAVCFDDELQQIAKELVRSGKLEKVHIGLDFFDASINRVAAWVIGMRNMIKSLLFAFLEPIDQIRQDELEMDFTKRLVMFEELKSLPWSAVLDYILYAA